MKSRTKLVIYYQSERFNCRTMFDLRGTSFWIVLIVASLNGVKTNYGACPFAEIHGLQDPGVILESSPTNSYVALPYSNNEIPRPDYNGLQSSVPTFLSIIQDYSKPMYSDNDAMYSENMIFKDLNELNSVQIAGCAIPPTTCTNYSINYNYHSIDGSCNNLRNPGLGMARSRYGRLLPPNIDHYDQPETLKSYNLPPPRVLSLVLFGEDSYQDEYRTLASMQWGQIIAHDLSRLTNEGAPDDCCAESGNDRCIPIYLHPQGPISSRSGKQCISFSTATSDKDLNCQLNPYQIEKISVVTAFLDLSSVYGNSQKENNKIRQFKGGLLKTSFINNRQWLPIQANINDECGKDNYKCYNIPDRRNQFFPSIIAIQTLLWREHNRIACILAELNPQYTDEELYQEARKINIAVYQHISYYEWIPNVMGKAFALASGLIYNVPSGHFINDYDETKNPAPYIESAAAAFRHSHTQVPGYFSMISSDRYINETKRLSDFFEKPSNTEFMSSGENYDYLMRGIIEQPQKQSDNNIDKELKHYFDRKITEEFGGDLKAMDINRGRDFGLRSYNDVREFCGLRRAYDWADFMDVIPAEKIELMKMHYASHDDVELVVGGSLEKLEPESQFGFTFRCILKEQFKTARVSDRLFFESVLSGFSSAQLEEIRKTSMAGLICNNADFIRIIQPNVFMLPGPYNMRGSCDSIPQMDLSQWKKPLEKAFYEY